HKAFHARNGDPGLPRQLQDRRELRVAFSLAVVNDNVTPNAAVRFRGAAVERYHCVEGCIDRCASSLRTERCGIVTVETHRRYAFGRSHGLHFARQRRQRWSRIARAKHFDDTGRSESSGEKQSAVTHLAPKVAPNVVRGDCARLEVHERAVYTRKTLCLATV